MQHTKKKSDVGSAAKTTTAATPPAPQNNTQQQKPQQNIAAANTGRPSPVAAQQPAPAVPKQEPKQPAINTNPQRAVSQNMMANLMSSDAAALNAITIKKEPEKAEEKTPNPTLFDDFSRKNPVISDLQKKFNLKPC